MLVHAITLPAGFRVFGAKITVAPEICLGLSDVRVLKPKHHLCDVFRNFGYMSVTAVFSRLTCDENVFLVLSQGDD